MSFDWKQQRLLHKQYKADSMKDKPSSSLDEYKTLAQEAYSKKPRSQIGDWSLLVQDKNNKVYQNRQSLELVSAIAGSKTIGDFANDGLQILGFRNNPLQEKRYAQSAQMMDRLNAVPKAPKISTASHSLGSNISNRLFKDNKFTGNGYNFNGFYARQSDNIDDKRIVNVRNTGDLASYLSRDNENSINLESGSNAITAHFIDNIRLLESG